MANQNVVVASATDIPEIHSKYASISSYVLGGKQIVLGIVLIILIMVAMPKQGNEYAADVALSMFGYFAVCSTFLITGVCGIAAGLTKTTCSIIGFMVMSVISSVLAAFFCFGFMFASTDNDVDNDSSVKAFVYSFIALFFAETVASIWSAAICCKAVCCGRRVRGAVIRHVYVPLHSHPSVMTTIQRPLQAGASTDVSQISFGPLPVY